ncbi:MAG TPA: LLM class flavin-dependent oxidoreductase [Actinomycetota bacterium]|nr:LLM class flavin-dependent oxidoreductase [Actinomycetota bacterium]
MDIEFGLNVSADPTLGADPVTQAIKAEQLGFDFVSASDHLHGEHPTYEPWTLLAWIASSTSRLRVATRVLATPYRNPAVLAKMAETFDRLSRGRLILGLGAGYLDEEFRAFGLRVPTAGEKVRGLEEAIAIARGLWSAEHLTFEGSLYRTLQARLEPKPDHSIPIWLGTYGPRALDVTGRMADGWIPTLQVAPPERVAGMRRRVLAGAERADRNPDDILCVYNLGVQVAEAPLEHPGVLAGPPEWIAERLLEFTGIGFRAFNFLVEGPASPEQVERLSREVLPLVRTG